MHGMTVSLKAPPVLDGYDVTGLRYIPEIAEAQVQGEPGQPWRRMTQQEIRDADALLLALTTMPEKDNPNDLRPHLQHMPGR